MWHNQQILGGIVFIEKSGKEIKRMGFVDSEFHYCKAFTLEEAEIIVGIRCRKD